MKLNIDKRYLKTPVSRHASLKKVCFYGEDGTLVYDLDIRLDPVDGQFIYYADMKPYIGRELEITCEPAIDFNPVLVDEAPAAGGETYRPEAHFTPARGWINDPNGLILYEGKYHLFFQHNPVGMYWGNMHWGHAVSTDLMHWEEKEIALFPDKTGTMYSGCAIVDEKNLTGLQENEHAPMLLYYTAAGGENKLSEGQPYTQCLAYSTDGGETFKKYAGNPVVGHIAGSNRDPKVIYCPEMAAYIMALYLTGRTYALLKSENLLDWNLIQRIDIAGDDECPDFYPLELEGETYWVLSGASDFYLVGKMTEQGFVPVQESARLNPDGGRGYAAQTYSGLGNNRRVRVSWNTFDLVGMPFNGAMATPVDLFLRRIDGKVVLCARPVEEIKELYGMRASGKGTVLLPGRANDITITIPADSGDTKVNIMGLDLELSPAKSEVRVGKCVIHANASDGKFVLRVIQDVHSMELYSSDGAGYVICGHLADKSLARVAGPEWVCIDAVELKKYRV